MVQFLPKPQPFEGFNRGLSEIGDVLGQFAQRKREGRERLEESKALEEAGYNIPGSVKNPKLRESLLEGQVKSQQASGDLKKNAEQLKSISKFFGPQVAELYPHLTEGGKTELIRNLLLAKERQQDTSKVLTEYFISHPEEAENVIDSKSLEYTTENIPKIKPKTPEEGLSAKSREEMKKGEIGEQSKYLKEIREKYQRAQSFKPVFEELRQTINSGATDALSMGNVSDIGNRMGGFLGGTLNAIGKAYESGETGKFRALSKRLLDEMKDIFGGQIRVKELEVFLSMLPEIGKSKEANLSAIDVLERLSEASSMYYETAQDIIQQNDGKIPRNLSDQVQEKLKPVMKDIAANIGNTTKNFSKNTQSKTLTREDAQKLLSEAKGDKELARQIAKERGYKLNG